MDINPADFCNTVFMLFLMYDNVHFPMDSSYIIVIIFHHQKRLNTYGKITHLPWHKCLNIRTSTAVDRITQHITALTSTRYCSYYAQKKKLNITVWINLSGINLRLGKCHHPEPTAAITRKSRLAVCIYWSLWGERPAYDDTSLDFIAEIWRD